MTNTNTNDITTQWNTNNMYSRHGQRIVARWHADSGLIIFSDIDRMVSGALADGTAYDGGKTTPKRFDRPTVAEIQRHVRSHYVGGYSTISDYAAKDVCGYQPSQELRWKNS